MSNLDAGDLKSALAPIQKILPTRPVFRAFSSFCFQDDWVFGWTDSVGVRAKSGLTEMHGVVVEEKPFFQIVNSLNGEVGVDVEAAHLGENDVEMPAVMRLQSGRSEWKFNLLDDDAAGVVANVWPKEFPSWENAPIRLEWNAEMKENFRKLMRTVEQEGYRPYLSGIHILKDEDEWYMLSSNAQVLTEVKLEGLEAKHTHYMIPQDLVHALMAIPGEGEIWVVGKKEEQYWYGRVGGHEIMCRNSLADVTKAKLRDILANFYASDAEKDSENQTVTEELLKAVSRAKAIVAWTEYAKVRTEDGELVLEYAGRGSGEDRVQWAGDLGEKFHISVEYLDWVISSSDKIWMTTHEDMRLLVGRKDHCLFVTALYSTN